MRSIHLLFYYSQELRNVLWKGHGYVLYEAKYGKQ